MDRIIIIGNGFDLAHELKTGYGDFMQDLQDSIVYIPVDGRTPRVGKNGKKCDPFEVAYKDQRPYLYHRIINGEIQDPWIAAEFSASTQEIKLVTNPHMINSGEIAGKTIYFQELFSNYKKYQKWSDLEKHYFDVLLKKNMGQSSPPPPKYRNINSQNIEIINKEFEHLKQLLEEYLRVQIENTLPNTMAQDAGHKVLDVLEKKHPKQKRIFDKTYFITFNYTGKLLRQYYESLVDVDGIDAYPEAPIHIHGELDNDENPIIFGYGDEKTPEYKDIEDSGINEALKNFKTFQYLRSNRYRKILALLEQSENIYVQIIGHSCGLCDKALLKAIFEHQNVKHIEAVYHEKEENYFNNLYNISRIFDDNTMMRDRMISLKDTYCIPPIPKK